MKLVQLVYESDDSESEVRMLENYLVIEDSLENVVRNDETIGFRFAVRACNYRGCFLSLVNGYYVECDGIEYAQKQQKFQINGKPPRSYAEIKKAVWEHWDFGDDAYIYVELPGGLAPGKHQLVVQESILAQYGYAKWDQEWVENPPNPKDSIGKVSKPGKFEMELKGVYLWA